MVDKPQSEEATRFVERVGVVGLGHMGHAFAVNLVEDGYQVSPPARTPSKTTSLDFAIMWQAHCGPDPIQCAAVLGPIKAEPFGWPRRRGQP
jgi:NAD binding domain of 6-phosphogluconate dehydrogenase